MSRMCSLNEVLSSPMSQFGVGVWSSGPKTAEASSAGRAGWVMFGMSAKS